LPSLFRQAEHLLRHPEELLAMLTRALGKAYARRTVLLRVFEDFLMLFRLVRSWVKGEYSEVPRKTILWALLAILYFLNPIDAIPDIFPGGYLDDIALISFILNRIKDDLDKFSKWEKSKK
jgi:uncharacterized membrane protein YkvA (DUF1232 family)